MMDAAAKAYVALAADGTDTLLMAADHSLRRELARRVRDDLVRLGLVDSGPGVSIADGATASCGDLIVCTRNDHTVEAGETGPDTSTAAKSAAAQFFALYSASQWSAAWALMTPADQRTAPLPLYEAVHKGCPVEAAGLAYQIEQVTMAGKTAVVTYTIPVMKSLLGSATMPMTLTAAGWRVNPDLGAEYSHGSATADIEAEKAAGGCAS